MTHDDAMDRLQHALDLVNEVASERINLRLDMRGRMALQDAQQAIDRAQTNTALAMRQPMVRQ